MKINYLMAFFMACNHFFAQTPGNPDPNFLLGTGFNGTVQTMGRMNNGKIFAGGDFTQYQGMPAPRVLLLNNDGTRDTAFQSNTTSGANLSVRSSFVLPNNKLLLGGIFQTYNGVPRSNLIQLLPDGRIDTTFNPSGAGPNNEVTHITSDGNRIIISGFFSQYNGLPAPGTIVLTMNGLPDPTFTTPMVNQIQTSAIAPDGKIYIGGNFSTAVGAAQNRIARLLPSGALDASFQIGTGFIGVVRAITIQPDGRVLVGGSMSSFNGTAIGRIVRLMPNGALDTSFQTITGFNSTVTKMTLQPNGKIIVTGLFTLFNGQSAPFIERLESDGRKDTCINFGTGFQGNTTGLALEPTGSFTVSGGFTLYKGQQYNRMIRIFDTLVSGATLPTLSSSTFTLPCAVATLPMQILSGALNDATHWEWYKDSCSGTPIDTGWAPNLQNITPGLYFVKGKGASACNCAGFSVIGGGPDLIPPVVDTGFAANLVVYCPTTITQVPTATDNCDGTIVGSTTDPISFSQPGNYSINWLFRDASGNTTTWLQHVDFRIIDTSFTTVFNPLTGLFDLTAIHQTPTAQYFWRDCRTGLVDSTNQTPTYAAPARDLYALIIVEGACRDSSKCKSTIGFPTDDASQPWLLYPNPTTDVFVVTFPDNWRNVSAVVMDDKGKIYVTKHSIESGNTIDCSSLAAGAYWVRLQVGTQMFFRQLVVVH